MKHLTTWTLLLIFAAYNGATAQQADVYGDRLRSVRLPVSCNEAVKPHLERGLALLHHMTYEGTEQAFAAATEADPQCAISY